MLDTVRRAFRIEEIRKKIFYTFLMLIVVRFGSQLPAPGVDPTFIQNFFANQTGNAFNFLMHLPGVLLPRCRCLLLSTTPYITSSIIMQLLTIAIPKLEDMQKEGAGMEEDCGDHKICDGRSCIDRVYCNGSRIRTSGTSR